jgi:polar amino acid transport system substrate-binding protein
MRESVQEEGVMRRILAAVVCVCAAAAAAAAPHAGSMQILTADIPPMAFMKDGRVTGYCVDIVREIQRRIGNSTEIELQPWARAYRSALEGENVLLVCPKRTPEREVRFKWVGPLFTSQTNFYARPADRVRIHSLEDAKKLSGVLAPRDFYSYQYLSDAGFMNLEPTNNTLTMLRMLLGGRRPVMVLDHRQLQPLLEEAGAHPEQVEMVYTAFTIGSYLSFPKQAPAEQVAQWQRALDKMKQDGAFARIYRQWYQEAPPPDVMK